MLKLNMGRSTTRQSPCTTWEIQQRPSEGALISFSEKETVSALFSQPRAFVSFGGTKERGSRLRLIS